MYLHLGQETTVSSSSIIGIFDLEITSQSKITRSFLSGEEKAKRVVNVSEEEIPRSFVVCHEKGKTKVYISQISSATLKKRLKTSLTESR